MKDFIMMGPEQREWQRIVVNMVAKCRVVDGPARYDHVNITDMHHYGCCVQGEMLLEQSNTVRLVLDLPFEGTINLTGEVVWSGAVDQDGMIRAGIKFMVDNPLAEEMCLKLYNYCLMRQPKE